MVIIVDTEEELQRFLTSGVPSPQPNTPFLPPGWVGSLPPPQGMPYHGPPPFVIGAPQPMIFRGKIFNHPFHVHPHPIHSPQPHQHASIYGTRSRAHIYKSD